MSRRPRVVVPGCAHHLTHRGNRRGAIFLGEGDYRRYLELLAEQSAELLVEILGYCLMPNHVHLVARPDDAPALGRLVNRVHSAHARGINAREGWTGHLFANRYYSAPLDDESAVLVVKYVELNPVRAGLVSSPADWPWSSARAHLGATVDPLLPDRPFAFAPEAWRAALGAPIAPSLIERLRRQTRTGRPIGDERYVDELEWRLGQSLRARPPGPEADWPAQPRVDRRS